VLYRGNTLMPRKMRVHSVQWPIASGMGVYYRDANGAYLDLTPFVAFEDGQATTYEVGSINAPVWADILPTSRTGREANEDIYERVKRNPALTYTPVITQSGVVTLNAGSSVIRYWQRGDQVTLSFQLVVSAPGGAVANNQITVSLPVAAAVANADFGSGWIIRSSTGNRTPTTIELGTTAALRMVDDTATTAGLFIGQTGTAFAGALAAGDQLGGTITYQAA
jgi:hypothetical protein